MVYYRVSSSNTQEEPLADEKERKCENSVANTKLFPKDSISDVFMMMMPKEIWAANQNKTPKTSSSSMASYNVLYFSSQKLLQASTTKPKPGDSYNALQAKYMNCNLNMVPQEAVCATFVSDSRVNKFIPYVSLACHHVILSWGLTNRSLMMMYYPANVYFVP
ncbi:hypothetical protein Tco_1192813 [Tanacetum coccineum]